MVATRFYADRVRIERLERSFMLFTDFASGRQEIEIKAKYHVFNVTRRYHYPPMRGDDKYYRSNSLALSSFRFHSRCHVDSILPHFSVHPFLTLFFYSLSLLSAAN